MGGAFLKTANICKFPTAPRFGATLTVSCFVRESNAETMHKTLRLSHHRMILFAQGTGSMRIDGVSYPFRAGTLLFVLSGESITLSEGEDVVYMYVDFSGARAEELLHRFHITALTRCEEGYDGLIPLWQESLARAVEDTIDLAAESILLHTFSRLRGADAERRGIIAQIVQLTEQSFNDPEWNLTAIARELSYHPKYVSHVFKEKMGIPYSEYLRTVRLNYAITLFDHGIDSVKNVSLLSGFSDPLYFSNVFKKSIGMSPKEYVQAKQKKNPAE